MPIFVISGKRENAGQKQSTQKTIYAENVRMWTSSLVGPKKCKGG